MRNALHKKTEMPSIKGIMQSFESSCFTGHEVIKLQCAFIIKTKEKRFVKQKILYEVVTSYNVNLLGRCLDTNNKLTP